MGDVGSVSDVAGVTPSIINAAVVAIADISAHSFRFVWIANFAIALASACLCLFLRPVAEEMTVYVESALEDSKLRAKQMRTSKVIDIEL